MQDDLQQAAAHRGKNRSRRAGKREADQDGASDRNQENDRAGAILGSALRLYVCFHCTLILTPMQTADKSTEVMN